MHASEIRRWLDDATQADDAAVEALRAAQLEGPNHVQLERILDAVHTQLASAPTPTPAAVSPRLASRALAKWGTLTSLGLLALGGALHMHKNLPQPSTSAELPPTLQMTPTQVPPPSPQDLAPEALPLQPVQSFTPHTADPRKAETAPAQPSQPERQQPEATPMRARQARARQPPLRQQRIAAPSDTTAPPCSAPLEVLKAEALLLQHAKRELARAPAHAQQLLLEHQRSYTHGCFVEEREAVLVEASWRAGDQAHARQRASRFNAQFPSSPYRRRLEDLLHNRL